MLNIGFYKGLPTEYVIKYTAGRVAREGAGLAFYYLQHNTSVAAVPTSSRDASFVFNETTGDFQAVTIQGQFTFRIVDPKQAASLLNFTIDLARRTYVSDDPDKLAQRIANVIQMVTRTEVQGRSLQAALRDSQLIAGAALTQMRDNAVLQAMGVEVSSVYFLAAKPTPEVAKALEAEHRERLLRQADEAVYARRAAAVEEERKIKENEQSTEIALEQRRQQLIELQGNNAQQEAEYKGRALEQGAVYRARASEMELGAYKTLDPATLMAIAMRDFGRNAAKIGNLTITSDILAALLNATSTPSGKSG